jgi:hypothetical protein
MKNVVKNLTYISNFFFQLTLKKNRIVFLNKNIVFQDLLENLSFESRNFYFNPSNHGCFLNTHLYNLSLTSFQALKLNFNTVIVFDITDLTDYVIEFQKNNIPVVTLNSINQEY